MWQFAIEKIKHQKFFKDATILSKAQLTVNEISNAVSESQGHKRHLRLINNKNQIVKEIIGILYFK